MGQGVSNSDLLDLVNLTKEQLEENQIEVALAREVYEIVDTLFTAEAVELDAGTPITRRVVLDSMGNAQMVRLYQPTDINVGDVSSKVSIEYCQAQTHWSVERREVLRNATPAKIVDLVKVRRIDAMVDMAELLETIFWLCPNDTADDLSPLGVAYWVPYLDDAQNGAGFYGGVPTTAFTTVGGIIPSTSGANTTAITGGKKKWRTYAAGGTGYYTGSIDATAIRTFKKAFIKTRFRAPRIAKDLERGPKAKYKIFCNTDSQIAYEERGEKQGDRNQSDLAPFNGATSFKRVPLLAIPALDADTKNPWYFLNMNNFKVIVHKGDHFREDEAIRDRALHNVFTTFVDASFNILCNSRQKQAVVRATA